MMGPLLKAGDKVAANADGPNVSPPALIHPWLDSDICQEKVKHRDQPDLQSYLKFQVED